MSTVAEPIVGKSAAAPGTEAEEYTLNKGSCGRKKITFVGASSLFVHKVLRDMLLVGGFNDVELCVFDLRKEPMTLVADLLERIARQKKTNIKVTRTMDRATALKGADAIILSITTGGAEADFRSFEACARNGVLTMIGDTLGPAALARNLRTVPIVVELAREIERINPKAVILNFTNPMSVLTGAMARFSNIPAWGLCHSADELFSYFSRVFNVNKREVAMEVGGVNHQCFVSKLMIKGKDRTKDILQATLDSEAKLEDNLLDTHREEVAVQQDIFRAIGSWPSCGHSHAAEFYKYFDTERGMTRYGLHESLKKVKPGREPLPWRQPHPILLEWAYGPEPVGDLHLLTTEHAHELLWSVFTGEPFSRILNVLNTGEYLKGIPKTACVEAMVTVAGSKVTGQQIQLPPAVQSLVHQWTTIHELSIQAAMNCDRDAARQALFLDPHVRELDDIAPLLEDILNATKQWLSPKWFA